MMDWETWRQAAIDMGLLHLGFLTVACAYLVRDVLYLRLLAVAGYGFFIAEGLRAMAMPNPTLLAWYTLFLVVNAVQAWHVAQERRRAHLTPNERRLADLCFASLDTAAARRLMRHGLWRDLADGTELAQQGRAGDAIYAIAKGRVTILVDGEAVAEAVPGQLVGEIGFLTRGPATATAAACGPVQVLVWDRRKLQRAIDRSPMLHDAAFAAFGIDLARKVAEQSLRPRRAPTSAGA